jgi:hypothetical protein
MNYTRIVAAAVAATVADLAYGFVVYGMLLKSSFALYPGVYRPADLQVAYMPYLALGILLAMIAASIIYAKGYEGGSGVQEGARFGVLIALVAIGYATLINYATITLGRRHTGLMALAALGEWILAGVVIGLVYKPGPVVGRTGRL